MDQLILNKTDIERILSRFASQILEKNRGSADLAIIGIRKGGTNLANRICQNIHEIEKACPLQGHLDINLYRDDFALQEKMPVLKGTQIDFNVDGKKVVLVDDVLYTGRTIRAALDAIMDLGRPARIELAVLIDRGLRELPIQADFVGKTIATLPHQNIIVTYGGSEAEDGVVISNQDRP